MMAMIVIVVWLYEHKKKLCRYNTINKSRAQLPCIVIGFIVINTVELIHKNHKLETSHFHEYTLMQRVTIKYQYPGS